MHGEKKKLSEFVFIVVGLNPVGSAIATAGFATLTSSIQSTKVAPMLKNQVPSTIHVFPHDQTQLFEWNIHIQRIIRLN